MNLCPAISQLCSQQTPFLGSAPEVFALGSLQSLRQAVTPPAARGNTMQTLSWTTVCFHPRIKGIISFVNNITLTMETASCPPARQLLPFLWSCASAESACPHCPPQHTGQCCPSPAKIPWLSAPHRAGWRIVCLLWYLCHPYTFTSPLVDAKPYFLLQ